MADKIRFQYFLSIYFLFLIVLCVLPVNTKGELNAMQIATFRGDYFFHALLFCPLLPIFWLGRLDKKMNTLFFIGLGVMLAFGSEWLQYLLPYRTFNLKDVIADVSGLAIGSLILLIPRKELTVK